VTVGYRFLYAEMQQPNCYIMQFAEVTDRNRKQSSYVV